MAGEVEPILTSVLERIQATRAQDALPIVVMDLDSTVIHTGPRHLAILREFADAHGGPDLVAVTQDIAPSEFRFLVEGPLLHRGWDEPTLLNALRAFWRDRFFDSAYCTHDQAVAGAPEFCRRILDAGGLVYYLTARPVDMVRGTFEVLLREGFPVLRGRAVLHMKPSRQLDDHRFKRGALADVEALRGVVCATFENEPAHADAFRRAFPTGIHVLVGDIRSPDAPRPHPDLVPLPGFR